MPKGQPFTSLCQSLYKNASTRRVDLHTHSTFSDGLCSPESVYSSACKLGLEAISITDHDTTAAHHSPFFHGRSEMIVGVEITCIFNAKIFIFFINVYFMKFFFKKFKTFLIVVS